MNNYCPFADAGLLGIIYKVGIPSEKKRLLDCLMILSNEWYVEQHTQKYFDAEKVVDDFMRRHLL